MVVTYSWAGRFSSAKSSLPVQHASWLGTVCMPDITIRGVRRITRPAVLGDTVPAAALLSRAFADDPLMAWVIPDERVRRRRPPGRFRNRRDVRRRPDPRLCPMVATGRLAVGPPAVGHHRDRPGDPDV